jgi:uncharacterized coiled-coil protein SlyX
MSADQYSIDKPESSAVPEEKPVEVTEEKKRELVGVFMVEVAKMGIALMRAFDLKSHIEGTVADEDSTDRYLLKFVKLNSGHQDKQEELALAYVKAEGRIMALEQQLAEKDKEIEELKVMGRVNHVSFDGHMKMVSENVDRLNSKIADLECIEAIQ